MSMMAHRIGSVPTKGFDWYVIFLEDGFKDELGEQIDKHFTALGKEVGERTLVVRGYEPTKFRKTFEAHALYGLAAPLQVANKDTPALLVTDAVPKPREKEPGHNSGEQDKVEPLAKAGGLDNARAILLPLRPVFEKDKDISTFFRQLVSALRDTDPRAIEKLAPTTIEKHWEFLTRYANLNPRFGGLGPKFDKIMGDLLRLAR